jgi:hypothetical protein
MPLIALIGVVRDAGYRIFFEGSGREMPRFKAPIPLLFRRWYCPSEFLGRRARGRGDGDTDSILSVRGP